MIPWFERRFDFSFPVEMTPKVCARLRGAAVRLEEAVRGVSTERLQARMDGSWSAQEHAGHLADMEPLWLLRLEDYVSGRAAMTPADLTNQKTHQAGHNARDVAEIVAEFRAERAGLVERAEGMGANVLARTLPHPRMGTPMRLVDHLYFVAEHDDHHLARMAELLQGQAGPRYDG